MGTTIYPTVPVARSEAEPWPTDEHTIRIDEMFARQLDTEFAGQVRGLLHDPETGVSARRGEAALEAIAGSMPALGELKERTLAQAIGPRQRSILEPLIETRLDWAAGTLGRLAHQATMEVDDASVADRLAGLNRDAAMSWRDPAYLRNLGRTAVEELRYQGERRGWDPAETNTKARSGLSNLYAGAVETAIGQDDLDGAATLYDHAREVIDPERQAAIDRRFARAREDSLLLDLDRALTAPPLDPARSPDAETIAARAAELMPEGASEEVRARVGQVAEAAYRRLDRQWNKQQSEAGVAALDWIGKNPGGSFLAMPPEIREWLAPDQWRGLETLVIEGRLKTDGDLFEQFDRQMVYQPEAFAVVDLDRHRLSLDDEDHARFAAAQKAIVEGRLEPGHVRYDWLRRGIDRTLKTSGIDTDGPVAAKVRAEARNELDSFEAIEGRPPLGADLDEIVQRAVEPLTPDPDSAAEADTGTTNDGSTDVEQIPPFAGDPNIIRVQGGSGGGRGSPPPRAPSTPGPRSTPGPGHNRPPQEVPPGLPQAIENWRRWFPPSPQPSGTQPAPDAAGPAAATEQKQSSQPLGDWLGERAQRADRDQYTGADGIDTAAGIKLDPRVGDPAAGRDYLPDDESHRKGLRGEYGLANDVVRQFPDQTVVNFGRKAGERGPDVISVNRDGEVTLWDSKWRSSDISIGPGGRAHQSEKSLGDAQKHTERSINATMKSGRLSPEAGNKALENLEKGNVTVVTVGTGSARNGVVEQIVGGERAVVHPERRP